mmetsp:Transcript_51218/g.169674  ORF Transcript_51218/g.169674 Transcript_51218/m.169674 type:complete len:426 (-) Transcript_51218:27-1304(-)
MASRPADTRERAAAALRVASCVAFCSVWVALHWSQIDGLHRLWVPSAAAVGLHKWWRRGLAAARDEVCGALYDFLRPAAACLRAWHDPSWRESYQRLMLALNTASCHFTSYGPVCKTTWILACAPYKHGVLAVWDQAEHFSGGVPPALLAGWLLALVVTWQCTVVANNLSHHRYYAHRSYDTSRPVALALGVLGCAATQRGPLWWSSNHRRHHRFCETAEDPHSPAQQGVVYAHCGWVCDRVNFPIRPEYCGEWLERPELLLLDANVELVSSRLRGWLTRGVLRLLVWCAAAAGAPPSLRLQYLTRYTTDTQLLALSLSLHWSSFVNSMCHDWAPAPSCGGGGGGGKGPCVGLSIPWVGLLSGGEGFHSRHHQNARNARHAERALLDPVYLVTCALERLGLVWSVQRQEAAGEARAGQRADLKAD